MQLDAVISIQKRRWQGCDVLNRKQCKSMQRSGASACKKPITLYSQWQYMQ